MSRNAYGEARLFYEKLKGGVQNTANRVSSFVQQNTTPASYVQRRVQPVVQRIQTPAPQTYARQNFQSVQQRIQQAPRTLPPQQYAETRFPINIGQSVGRTLQRVPQAPDIVGPSFRGQAPLGLIQQVPAVLTGMARSYGRTSETISTPQGRKQLLESAQRVAKKPLQLQTLQEPAFEAALNIPDFLPGGFLFAGGVRAMSRQAGKELLEKVTREGIEKSVLQIVDTKTGKVVFQTIKKGDLPKFQSLIDDTQKGIAGKNIGGKDYHLTAKTPEQMQKAGAEFIGRADVKDVPRFSKSGTQFQSTNSKGSTKQILQEGQKGTGAIDSTSGIQQGGSSNGSIPQASKETQAYLQELKNRQRGSGSDSKVGRLKGFYNEIRSKFVDSTAPIEDALSLAEKRGRFKVLPKEDVRLQIDRVLRSSTLSEQFAKDNGLADVILKVPDLDALDQYMIAKHARTVEATGRKTGRDLTRDKQLIQELGSEYEPYAQQVTAYSRKLLDYATETGLISKDLAEKLKTLYPDYVPLQRVMDEVERTGTFRGRGIASQGSQSVVQRLKGSDREISSPIASLIEKTNTAFAQGERNVAARQLASYRNIPGFKGLITELKVNTTGRHTFSYIENGVKRTFETTPEIEAAAKSLNRQQLGFLGKIVSFSTRLLRLGATGLNIPFVGANIVKDQLTGFINSSHVARTSLINPGNFLRALWSAGKHDELYDDLIRSAGGGTSFDIGRMQPQLAVGKIRSGRNIASKVAYTVTHPGELITTLENLIGRSEELGRLQQFRGTRQALQEQGRTAQDITLLAAKAARENTANFARAGDWGRVLNLIIPYFNAGIQGSRATMRAIQQRPAQTATKIAIGLFTPVAAATMWNLSDPERKRVYEDIDDFEKENNIILVLDPSKGLEKGRYGGVIKIPLQQGFGALSTGVRQGIEQAYGLAPAKMSEIASGLIQFGTSLNVGSPRELVSSLTPQALKVPIESATNTNLFTGKQIVPQYMKNKPAEEQVYDFTSGTARKIGGALNTSPLVVQNAISTSMGGVGRQLLNASDTALNKLGVIPEEQIGGESVGESSAKRFISASGGKKLDEAYEGKDKRDAAKREAIKLFIVKDDEKASKILKENEITIKSDDIKEYKRTQLQKAADLFVENKDSTAKTILKETGQQLTQEDIKKAAKRKAKELFRLRLDEEAKEIVQKYGITLTLKDLE